MALLIIAATSFVIALSGALVPGPLFTITVSETARRGFIAGPLIIVGHGILELAVVALLLLGAAPLITAPRTLFAIGLLGGVILAAMGLNLLRGAGKARLPEAESCKKECTGRSPVLSGIVGSISNPYWSIWWATIGLGYLLSSRQYGAPGIGAFFVGHILGDLAWYSLVSYTVAKGRDIMGQKGYQGLLYACGLFLVGFGAWFIFMTLQPAGP